jgi:hypothetical protein
MKPLALNAILAGMFGFIGGAQAQISPSFHSACPESKTVANWCPAQLSQEGWKLKYETESPRDLMDSFWRYEVWIRERTAIVCALVGGRDGLRINGCNELSEVNR